MVFNYRRRDNGIIARFRPDRFNACQVYLKVAAIQVVTFIIAVARLYLVV